MGVRDVPLLQEELHESMNGINFHDQARSALIRDWDPVGSILSFVKGVSKSCVLLQTEEIFINCFSALQHKSLAGALLVVDHVNHKSTGTQSDASVLHKSSLTLAFLRGSYLLYSISINWVGLLKELQVFDLQISRNAVLILWSVYYGSILVRKQRERVFS